MKKVIIILSILVAMLIVHSVALTNRVAEQQRAFGYLLESQKCLLVTVGELIQERQTTELQL